MQNYEVTIIGAGPAGCQCARHLARAGKKVLLVEKSKDFAVNSYSSGGSPLSIADKYQLPESIISSYWHNVALYTSNDEHRWTSREPMGVVLDFMKLRAFLSNEACGHNGNLMLGSSYHHHETKNGKTLVHLKQHDKASEDVIETDVIVDATGAERSVLEKNSYDKSRALAATGIEYHVQVDAFTYRRYADTLSFFIGQRWMPQGYAWIFPYRQNELKIGVIRYFLHQHIVPHDPSIRHYLELMMKQRLGSAKLPISDKHGKTLFYTFGQRDRLYDGNVIAIGDSISTLNPLASEGIRHAMASGDIAARHIIQATESGQRDFKSYAKDMQRYFGRKWQLSEAIMKRLYCEPDDHKLDLVLQAFKRLSIQELLSLGFDYDFGNVAKFAANYTLFRGMDLIKRTLRL